MRTILVLIVVSLGVAGVIWLTPSLTSNPDTASSWAISIGAPDDVNKEASQKDRNANTPVACINGLREYSNERYRFRMCVPEDAEVLTQYDAVDKSVLDLVFIQKTDLEKMRTSERFAADPYFAVLDTGISAFVMERSELLGEVDAERLKYILPKEIPCQHARFGCADGDTLAVELLSFDPVAGAPFPLFAYKDRVKAKNPWQNVGYIGHIGQVSYQLESIVPESAVSREALEIIASTIR